MLLGSWLLNVCQLYPFWACFGLDCGSSHVTVTAIYVAKLGCSLSLSLLLDPPTPHLLNSLWPKSCDITLQSTLLFLARQPDRFAHNSDPIPHLKGVNRGHPVRHGVYYPKGMGSPKPGLHGVHPMHTGYISGSTGYLLPSVTLRCSLK